MADGELTAFDVREARQQLTRIADALEKQIAFMEVNAGILREDLAFRREQATKAEQMQAGLMAMFAPQPPALKTESFVDRAVDAVNTGHRARRHRHQPPEPPEAA